jgi:hypothetical protein
MPTRKGRNPRSDALTLARNIKPIRSYLDDGVGWVEVLFNGNYELGISVRGRTCRSEEGLPSFHTGAGIATS